MQHKKIKAIETRYKGYLFRSRLEARWAVFFDALGLCWEYEPEGFDLGEDGRYLPDFRVEYPGDDDGSHHEWFEVKSSIRDIPDRDWRKLIAFGMVESLTILDGIPDTRMYLAPQEAVLPEEAASGLFDRDSALKLVLSKGIKASGFATDQAHLQEIREAVNAARSARFEHGRSGRTY